MLSRGQTDTLPGAPRQILEAGLAAHLPGFLAHDRCAASPHAEPPAELATNETTDAATVSSHAQPEEGCAPAVRRRQINFRLRGRAHRVAPGTLSLTLDRASAVPSSGQGHAAAVLDPLRAASGEQKTVAFARRSAAVNRKGIFTRQVEARDNAMVASLAKLGLTDMVGAKVKRIHVAGRKLDQQASKAVESMQDGQHAWRSKWSIFRANPSFVENDLKRRCIDAHRYMTRLAGSVRSEQEKRAAEIVFFRDTNADLKEVDEVVQALDMWGLRVSMPMKKTGYQRTFNVDSSFALKDLKQVICEAEGFHPTQQILHIKTNVSSPGKNIDQRRGSVPLKIYKKMHTPVFPPIPVMQKRRIYASDDETLGELNITADTVLELEIDKAAGKDLQRKLLMEEIGLDGQTFLVKTEEAFNRFDVDEVRLRRPCALGVLLLLAWIPPFAVYCLLIKSLVYLAVPSIW